MSKFVFVYHSNSTPEDAAPMDPAAMNAMMAEWEQWGQKVGSGLVDFGTPLGNGMRVRPGNVVTPSEREVVGYTIVEADSIEAAVGLAHIHPHLSMPAGCEIEVHECLPVPGM